jgi:hypothetical protein
MDKSHFKVAGVSLLVGAMLTAAAALSIGASLLDRWFPIHITGTPANPNDSPVTVRGGSIEIANPSGKLKPGTVGKKYAEYIENSTIANFAVYLHGVNTTGNPPWGSQTQPIENDALSNWKIVVWDRNRNSQEEDNTGIQICSAQPANFDNGCDTPTSTISGSSTYNTYFLIPIALCTNLPLPDIQPAEGKRDLLRIHDPADDTPKACGAPPPLLTNRDHIGHIDVTLADQTAKPSTYIYDCINGQCSISIGGAEP